MTRPVSFLNHQLIPEEEFQSKLWFVPLGTSLLNDSSMIELISYENRPNTGPNTCGFEAFKAAANLPDLTLELFKLGKH